MKKSGNYYNLNHNPINRNKNKKNNIMKCPVPNCNGKLSSVKFNGGTLYFCDTCKYEKDKITIKANLVYGNKSVAKNVKYVGIGVMIISLILTILIFMISGVDNINAITSISGIIVGYGIMIGGERLEDKAEEFENKEKIK